MHHRIAPFLVAFLAAGVLAGTGAAAPAEQAAGTKTVVGVAAGDKRFTTLVTLVKQAGLAQTLSATGPYTVFAPTNAAFAKLEAERAGDLPGGRDDAGTPEEGAHVPRAREARPSTTAVAAARQGASVKTVQGERIKLSLKAGKLVLNGTSRVIVADVKASNGVIHAIDTVLVPPSAA